MGEEAGFNQAIADAFAESMSFFTAGESEQSIVAMADAGMRTQVGEVLGGRWTQLDPDLRTWLANWPSVWPHLRAAWPQLPESQRQQIRNSLLPLFDSYTRAYRAAHSSQSAVTSTGNLAYEAGMAHMQMATSRNFDNQLRAILGLPPGG
jgi:hypothetical protein